MYLSAGVHPHRRQVVETMAFGTGHQIVIVPLRDGVTDWASVDVTDAAAVVAAYPNYLGVLEDLTEAKALAVANDALFVVDGDPVAASVLKSAADWGADVYVGEGQPFGTALSFGGPFLGLFACTTEQIRRLPGRIVGETLDSNGRRAFVTTLRAREQDIRREKATSNICSNQTLMAVTAAIQLGYLGTQGLAEVATRCAQGAHVLFDALTAIPGVTAVSTAPFFREFALRLPKSAAEVLTALVDEGILGGLSLTSLAGPRDPSVEGDTDNILLIAVTERRTQADIDHFTSSLRKVLA